MKCNCGKYLSPVKTIDEINDRCEKYDEIWDSLDEVTADFVKWMSVSKCKVCNRYWAMERPFGETQRQKCFYHIECDDPHKWLKENANILEKIQNILGFLSLKKGVL